MVPRGWVVALRPKNGAVGLPLCGLAKHQAPYILAFNGAVYAAKEAAIRIADSIRRLNPHYNVRVIREGLCK